MVFDKKFNFGSAFVGVTNKLHTRASHSTDLAISLLLAHLTLKIGSSGPLLAHACRVCLFSIITQLARE